MQLFLQKHIFSKCQDTQKKVSTKQRSNKNKSSTAAATCTPLVSFSRRIRMLFPDKNTVFPKHNQVSPLPCSDALPKRKHTRSSPNQLSAKALALESLIFDYPSVTIHIRPGAYRPY
ncbi:hypothetical protein BDF14DRAFT_1885081 [Spinellus fusiger]|nr:hypothetical protein BDF14DRAFT_1885081 [Spinellus fusiger]